MDESGGSERTTVSCASSILTIFLDGSTIQKTADILLDNPTTRDHRKLCKQTYLHSLADFTTAVISGSRLAVVNMPEYAKGVHPGKTLVEEWFPELFENAEGASTFTSKTIFD